MCIWDDHEVGRWVCEALAEVTPPPDPGHHFGQPFVTAYQLAIKVDRDHPEIAVALGVKIGGTGTGSHNSLAQYLARELSQRISHRQDDLPVEGAFLSNDEVAAFSFVAPDGRPVRSSLTGSGYPMSLFRRR